MSYVVTIPVCKVFFVLCTGLSLQRVKDIHLGVGLEVGGEEDQEGLIVTHLHIHPGNVLIDLISYL